MLLIELFWKPLLAGIVRVLVGWIKSSVAIGSDLGGAISNFELWTLAKQTVITVLSFLVVYFSLSGFGVADPEVVSLVIGLVFNELWRGIEKRKELK